jgi:hypothetical protein
VASADFLAALAAFRAAGAPGGGGGARGVATVGGVPYRVRGRVARGESGDVYLAERDRPLTERVVLKVPRAPGDEPRLARAWAAVGALRASRAPGAAHFVDRLPRPVAHGPLRAGGAAERRASVYGWPSGFVHTFDDVARAHPGGVDPRAAVWLWRRTLEALGFVHASGWAHGAVSPRHLLVHARDHGVLLVGWSRAARWGAERSPGPAGGRSGEGPPALASGAPPGPADDIEASARCVAGVLGGYAAAPEPLATLLARHARPAPDGAREVDAWALARRLDEAARRAFGPRGYCPFAMPGWR